jgi:hypothetical protein
MQLRPLAFALASALLATTASCETRVSLGTPCRSAAECNDGLLCSFGRCRAGCERQTDCAGEQVCIQETGQRAVCTLVDDTCAGANTCSAGLVCNTSTSVCAVPCTPMSCVSGSSCSEVSATAICVRDDLADAGMRDAGSDAFVSLDAPVDALSDAPVDSPLDTAGDAGPRCLRERLVSTSTASLPALFGASRVQPVTLFDVLDNADMAPEPVLAVGIQDRHVWVVGNRDATSRAVIVEADFPATAPPGFPQIMGWDFSALDDVSAVDVRRGSSGLSALLVRRDPILFPAGTDAGPTDAGRPTGVGTTEVVMWHVRDTRPEPARQTVTETTMDPTLFPGGAALFGIMPNGDGDDSAIAFAKQRVPATADPNELFLIDGNASGPMTLTLPPGWGVPVVLRGATGALAALNTATGEVRFTRTSGTRTLPNSFGPDGEAREAIAMDLTNAPGSSDAFLMATVSNSCTNISVSRIECVGTACRVARSVRVPTAAQPIDVRVATLAAGYAVVTTHLDGATVDWLDVDLALVATASLFPQIINTDYTFDGLAIDADAGSFLAVARYRSVSLQRHYGTAYFGE